jgi:hypothetical protein
MGSLMNDAASPDALTMLVYALDEMRETTGLIPVAELSRSTSRSRWRSLLSLVAGSRAEVGAGLSMQYLGENLERARAHWREALSLFDQLQLAHHDNEVVARLGEDLWKAGLNEVLAQLHDEAIPHVIAKTAEHLAGVVATIRDCDRLVVEARNKLTLNRMRDE